MGWILAALGFAILFFMPGLLQQFDVPKIEAVRVCGLGALAASAIAGLAGWLRRWRALDVAVVAWLAVEVLATVLSRSPRLSVLGEPRQREGLLTSLALAGLYFAARDAFARPGRFRVTLTFAAGLAGLAGLYALAQVTGHDWMEWRREAVYAGGYVRPFATLGHPNLLGVVTAAAAAAALACALATRGALARAAFAALALLATLVTVLTLSRAAWLAGGLALPLAALLGARERGATIRHAMAAAGGMAVVLTLGALLATRAAPVAGPPRRVDRRRERREPRRDLEDGVRRVDRAAAAGAGARSVRVLCSRATRPRSTGGWNGPGCPRMPTPSISTRSRRGARSGFSPAWPGRWLWTSAARAWRTRASGGAPGSLAAAIAMTVAIAVAGAFGAIGITGALLLVIASAAVASLDRDDAVIAAPATASAPTRALAGRGSRRRERDAKSGACGTSGPSRDRRRRPARVDRPHRRDARRRHRVPVGIRRAARLARGIGRPGVDDQRAGQRGRRRPGRDHARAPRGPAAGACSPRHPAGARRWATPRPPVSTRR